MGIFDQVVRGRTRDIFKKENISQLNQGLDRLPGQIKNYVKENPKESALIGAAGATGLTLSGLAARQVAKTTPDEYDATARNGSQVNRSTGRTVDRLADIRNSTRGVPTYKLLQDLKDNNQLGVRPDDTHAEADTKLGIMGGAVAGLGTAVGAPWLFRKGRAGLKAFSEANLDKGSDLRNAIERFSKVDDEVADDAAGLGKKWLSGRVVGGTATGATMGGVGGYRNGIYQDELDKKELHTGQQKLAQCAQNLHEAMERFAEVGR